MSAPKECPAVCQACGAPRKEDAGNYYACHSWIRPSGNLHQSPECEAREASAFRRKLHDAIGDPDWNLDDEGVLKRTRALVLFVRQYAAISVAAKGDHDRIFNHPTN